MPERPTKARKPNHPPQTGEIEALFARARTGNPRDRGDAINRLWGFADSLSEEQRDQLADLARSALGDPDERVRAQAAFALGELGNPEDIERLASVLSDPAWFTRLAAAYALYWQHPPRLDLIAQLRDDPEREVREQVGKLFKPKGAARSVERDLRRFVRALPGLIAVDVALGALVVAYLAVNNPSVDPALIAVGTGVLLIAVLPLQWIAPPGERLSAPWKFVGLAAAWAAMVIGVAVLAVALYAVLAH